MTFEEYLNAVEAKRQAFPTWRQGQAYFNVLILERPDLAELARGEKFDPFYKAGDELRPFFEWAQSHW